MFLKKIIAITIALLPFNILRIICYRLLLGYNVSSKSKIGWLNFILCKELKLDDNSGIIGNFNIITGVNKLVIGKNSFIIKFNRFRSINKCIIGNNVKISSSNSFFGTIGNNISPFKEFENIYIGDKSIITHGHIFDLSDEIKIGEDVTFGGSGSQIWTHGFDLYHTKKQGPITIGNQCYIGSKSIILPRVKICDKVSIGSGTIISKNIQEEGFYTSSQLIRKMNNPDFKLEENVKQKNGFFFLRVE